MSQLEYTVVTATAKPKNQPVHTHPSRIRADVHAERFGGGQGRSSAIGGGRALQRTALTIVRERMLQSTSSQVYAAIIEVAYTD